MKLKIMIRAAKIRMSRGEDIEAILAGWPNLTKAEQETIRESV